MIYTCLALLTALVIGGVLLVMKNQCDLLEHVTKLCQALEKDINEVREDQSGFNNAVLIRFEKQHSLMLDIMKGVGMNGVDLDYVKKDIQALMGGLSILEINERLDKLDANLAHVRTLVEPKPDKKVEVVVGDIHMDPVTPEAVHALAKEYAKDFHILGRQGHKDPEGDLGEPGEGIIQMLNSEEAHKAVDKWIREGLGYTEYVGPQLGDTIILPNGETRIINEDWEWNPESGGSWQPKGGWTEAEPSPYILAPEDISPAKLGENIGGSLTKGMMDGLKSTMQGGGRGWKKKPRG